MLKAVGALSIVFAVLIVLGVSLSAVKSVLAVDDPEEFLAGFWVMGAAPLNGWCDARPDASRLVQFDFDAAGGWMVTYNSFDAFMFGPLTVEKTGDATLLLAEAGRKEEVAAPSTLRVLSDDSFEFVPDQDMSAPAILYRCHMPEDEEPERRVEPELAPRPMPDAF